MACCPLVAALTGSQVGAPPPPPLHTPTPPPRSRHPLPPPAVYGEWVPAEKTLAVVDPLNGEPFLRVPDTQLYEIEPFVASLR